MGSTFQNRDTWRNGYFQFSMNINITLSHMLQTPGNLCLIFAEKMMEGNSYSEASLREAIIQKFGKQQHFYACSAEDMDVDTLIEFLKKKGKFMLVENGFTVDISKVCNH